MSPGTQNFPEVLMLRVSGCRPGEQQVLMLIARGPFAGAAQLHELVLLRVLISVLDATERLKIKSAMV